MMDFKDVQRALKGIVIVQCTPFRKDGAVDLEGMRQNTRWLLNKMKGKDVALMVEGSNGEFFNQSEEEWKTVVKMICEEVNGKIPVFVHTAQCGTDETIKRTLYAQSVGADAAIVVLPYYMQPMEEGMYLHYKHICDAVDIAVICYNNTGVSGCWIRPSLMAKIAADCPNFVGVKENGSDIISYRRMAELCGDNAVVLCGRGEEIYPYEARFGCPGFVTFLANFAPDLAYEMYTAAMAKNWDRVDEIHRLLSPFTKDPSITCNLPEGKSFIVKVTKNHGRGATPTGANASMQFAIVKAAMDLVGCVGGEVRLPLTPITADEKAELKQILINMGIIK
ncbi:MAG: dihydrodipicolinate synthase family protein [Sphaerochaetaceae bacterium]